MIAALFVRKNGVYFNIPGVDPWDEERDARTYSGPHRVVAHPPCQRWGRYWYGGPMLHKLGRRKIKGDDGGCFLAALEAVRKYGGVLEHPADSSAWDAFNLIRPYRSGGWIVSDSLGGWSCYVEQGHYGHRARKATWLYYIGPKPPELIWGPSAATAKFEDSVRQGETPEQIKLRREKMRKRGMISRLASWEREATPVAFRDLLISMASSVTEAEAGRTTK